MAYDALTCKLLAESLQLPLHAISTNQSKHDSFGSSIVFSSPLYESPLEQISALLDQELLQKPGQMQSQQRSQVKANSQFNMELPLLLTSSFMEQFMIVPVLAERCEEEEEKNCEKQPAAFIVIGPCSTEKLSAEVITNLMNDHFVSYKDYTAWHNYLQALPQVSMSRLLHIGILAYQLMNGRQLHIMDVISKTITWNEKYKLSENVETIVSRSRESSIFHMQLDAEQQFLEYVKHGKKDEILKWMIELPYEEIGILSKRSQLRNRKNLAIIAIAFATRAAIAGGLQQELAFTLSDLHIQHIEELKNVNSVQAAFISALLDFTERVSERRKQGKSRIILQCQEYIYNHIYEPLTLSALADLAGLSAPYLSQLFKRETGMTLSAYIQHEKIEEAKRLLLHSKDTVSSISHKLNYYDETYFVKVFKNYTGMTPRVFRQQYGNIRD